jgi:hypothetical protein
MGDYHELKLVARARYLQFVCEAAGQNLRIFKCAGGTLTTLPRRILHKQVSQKIRDAKVSGNGDGDHFRSPGPVYIVGSARDSEGSSI